MTLTQMAVHALLVLVMIIALYAFVDTMLDLFMDSKRPAVRALTMLSAVVAVLVIGTGFLVAVVIPLVVLAGAR